MACGWFWGYERATNKPCASSITVVNIYLEEFGVNNGFGAGYAASLMNQLART